MGAIWMTGMVLPSKVILAVRMDSEVLAVKAKLTTPLVMPVMVSHGESLTGANGPVKFAVAGKTTGSVSLPANGDSDLAVESTKAWGSSKIVLVPVI